MVFNATINNISVVSWRSVFWWRKLEYLEKTTDMPQITKKLDHKMLYQAHLAMSGIQTLVVIGTDSIGSCKCNYHTTTVDIDSQM